MVLGFNSKKTCPIGVDMGSGYLRMVQIGRNGNGLYLHSATLRAVPADIEFRSPAWQHWAVDTVRSLMREGQFKGKEVITALPTDDLFIDPVKVPRTTVDRLDEVIPPKLQKRLPFPVNDALFQYIVAEPTERAPSDSADILTIAVNREAVNRHLAIYEAAGLEVSKIGIWPTAMITSFSKFFCRRSNEQNVIALLLTVGTSHSNVVITRGANLLFARAISIGYAQLEQTQMLQRLLSELDACVRYFEESFSGARIERLVFLAGSGASRTLCDRFAELARRMQIPAQVGDVTSAIEINQTPQCLIDRRNSRVDWATAFGLSLEGLS
ncbi:MAG TPA: pilus assembly protein PilM [Anaerohalosphaeraceae bacterium]|nr:pilus assembly protein PilM [Phycisphaerae bacterium]HOK94633.1 pilus assembly protein PilM [Anaerohalosphaeraceae bacterium]HOM76044.1 pilus assembly protein PilM [Anaerohalosphaeraceae bacterium]HPC64206.1 pilus assembly protein PilM [Anaerohalosphaeraceae bacterium]HPO68826.1 pilus assembly protein PilM [Anaerohalosphaeraceae bacterium]